jgi:CBS domain-containing protein
MSAQILAHAPRRVHELMTPEVITLRPDERFKEAVELFAKHPFRHLVIAQADGRIAGVISDRDVLRAGVGYDLETTLVSDVMTVEPLTVQPDTPLSEAVSIALDYRVNCFPVVDPSGRICGILTTTDLMHALQKLLLAFEQLPELKLQPTGS